MIGNSGFMDFRYNTRNNDEMSYGSETHLGSRDAGCWNNRRLIHLLAIFLATFVLISIGLAIALGFIGIQLKNSKSSNTCINVACIQTAAEVLSRMDTTIDPCKDFYEFSCGGWIRNNPVPPTETTWGQFEILNHKLNIQIKDILEDEIDEQASPNSVLMTQEFYDTCITQDEITRDNTELLAIINRVISFEKSMTPVSFTSTLAALRREFSGNYIFTLSIELDELNTSRYAIYLDQPSFGIASQYLTDPAENQFRKNYLTFIRSIWEIVFPEDQSRVDSIASDVLRIERTLASIITQPNQRINKTEMYTITNYSQLENLTKASLNWDTYFKEVYNGTFGNQSGQSLFPNSSNGAITDFSNVIFVIRDVNFFKQIASFLDVNFNGRDLANYLKWRVLLDFGREANERLEDAFYQYDRATLGLQLPLPRWRGCVEKTNSLMGFAISYRYVQKYFPKKRLEQVKSLVDYLRNAFNELLKDLDWLDPTTREMALRKVESMRAFVGYPDVLLTQSGIDSIYEGLSAFTNPDTHLSNYIQLIHWHSQKQLAKTFQLQNHLEWIIYPTIINAFYSYQHNSINFPAGILQPPFFGMPVESMNFGAIGSIIGHEISHGFDDSGRQYDVEGNVRNWWRNRSILDTYKQKSQCFIDQYASYTTNFGENVWHVNGNNTLSENIADNGGLRQAFKAFQSHKQGRGEKLLPGLEKYTSDQLFYIAFAQVWCGTQTTLSLQQQLNTGPHAPNAFRVRGILSNSENFKEIWGCRSTSNHSNGICRIW